MPRNRAVALVIHNDNLLIMHRKNSSEYYTFPGGGVDAGETNEEAAVREILEETSVVIALEKQVYELHFENGDTHYYFLGRYIEGEPALQFGSGEYIANKLGFNKYTPQWMPVDQLEGLMLYPLELRDRITEDIRQNFPGPVVHLDASYRQVRTA
jgi:8-oxo-dGTP pyrophosphatase MutT (NUDIX family)